MITEKNQTAAQRCVYIFQPALSSPICSILFHGTGNDALFGWEDLILKLLASNRAVLCFDLDGHGATSTTRLSARTFWNQADCIAGILSSSLPAVRRLEAIGYSLGALLAARLACQQQFAWEKVVLLALPNKVQITWRFVGYELLSLGSAMFWHQLWIYGWRARIPAFGKFRRKAFPIRMHELETRTYPEFVQDRLEEWSFVNELPKLTVPVFLIFASQDQIANFSEAQSIARGVPSENCQVVSGTNHFLLPLDPRAHELILNYLQAQNSNY